MSKQDLKKLIASEYKKCAADPAYFMKKYCKIQHPSKGTVNFNLYPFQENAVREFRDNPKNIILKCRQMGISTLTAGYSMWMMTFHKDKSILVIATKQDVAKNLVTKVRFMNDNLPSWMRQKEVENNRTSLRLKNGSQIKAVSASGDAGRSEALSLLVVDEAAFIDQIDEIWTSVQSAMTHGGGNAIVLSTPNGMGNWFYRMWKESEEGIQKFNTIKLHWTLHPEYDQLWRDEQDVLLGPRGAAQECDCLWGDSKVKILDTHTNEESWVTLEDLYKNNQPGPNGIKHNNRYKIQTPNGFELFSGMRRLEKKSHYVITLSSGKKIKCSETHPFMCRIGLVEANALTEGMELWGFCDKIHVVSIEKIEKSIILYDVLEVDNGNIFVVDDIVSHNCSFVSSGNSVVDLEILKWYQEEQIKDPISKEYHDQNYWRWEYPDFTRTYTVCADVARGDGEDYSTFHVLDIERNVQVAEYRGKIETTEFGNLLVQVATEWNNALLIIENGTIGWATIQRVIDRNYQNLFYMNEDMKYIDPNEHITNKWNAREKRATAGFTMSVRTRPLIISKLDLYFRDKDVTIHSMRTINELMTFIWHNGKAQAAKGYNDDLTMALGIGLWVRDTALVLKQHGIDMQRTALDHMGKSKFNEGGVYSTGTYNRNGSGYPAKDPYTQNFGNGISEDLRWLLK